MFTYFTEVTKQDVVDKHGRWVGRPFDFTAQPDEAYPRLTSVVIAKGLIPRKYYVIPWQDLHHAGGQFQLKNNIESLEINSSYIREGEINLRKNILDQQVVDTFNRKVVRVNDIHLLEVNGDLRVAHVDVGIRGLVRRLGWERFVDIGVRVLYRHSDYLTKEKFISWKYVQPLSIRSETGKIQLNVDQKQLKSIPPPDLSEMLMELDSNQRTALFKTLDPQSQIDILTEFDFKWQLDLVDALDPKTTADLLERMPADEATDLLGAMSLKDSKRFLQLLSPKKSRELKELLRHETNSAGGLMTKEFVLLKESMTIAEALEQIGKTELKKAETIHTSFIVDNASKLIGAVSLRRLMLEAPHIKIGEVMMKKPPVLNVKSTLKDTANEFAKYNLFAMPVVDESGRLEGIVTVDDVLAIVIKDAWGRR